MELIFQVALGIAVYKAIAFIVVVLFKTALKTIKESEENKPKVK